MKIKNAVLIILKEFLNEKYNILYLPENGLGTGFAQLPIKAPQTYKYLLNKIKGLILLFII